MSVLLESRPVFTWNLEVLENSVQLFIHTLCNVVGTKLMLYVCYSCSLLHRTAGDTERRYHIRYYKTCPCVYETDSKGNCSKNGPHCAFAHGHADLRKPVYDIRELDGGPGSSSLMETPLSASLESDRLLNEDPVWNGVSVIVFTN